MANDKTRDVSEGEKTQKDSVGNQDKDNSKRIWISIAAFGVSILALIISGLGWNTANTGLIATTRPYLSVESLTENSTGDEYVSVMIGVTNYGELPATGVEVDRILLDGVPWWGTDIIGTPEVTYTTEDNVTITTIGIVVGGLPPEQRDLPNNIIFHPKKHNTFVVTVSKDKWSRSIAPGSVMEIKLDYSWGKYDYWYTAACMLEASGEWSINLERGN